MVKSVIVIICTLAIIMGGSVFENCYVNSKFGYFEENIGAVIESAEKHEDNSEKLSETLSWWKDAKHVLHAFIPHDDIRDVDGLIAQSITLIKKGEYDLALTQLNKLNILIKSIPENFHFNFGNIF
jgi:hypothetical protein